MPNKAPFSWRWLIVVGIVLGLIVEWNFVDSSASPGTSPSSFSSATNGEQPADSRALVRYEVSGPGEIDISYDNADGGENRHTANLSSSAPWWKTLKIEYGTYVRVSAHNWTDDATVSCKLMIDGEIVDTARSNGDRVSAFCSAFIGS